MFVEKLIWRNKYTFFLVESLDSSKIAALLRKWRTCESPTKDEQLRKANLLLSSFGEIYAFDVTLDVTNINTNHNYDFVFRCYKNVSDQNAPTSHFSNFYTKYVEKKRN